MPTIYYTEEFEERFKELPLNIQKKAARRELIFRQNPFNPLLNTEKLHPKSREVWSFRVDENYRILFRFKDNNVVYFLTAGPHHWIYRYMDRA